MRCAGQPLWKGANQYYEVKAPNPIYSITCATCHSTPTHESSSYHACKSNSHTSTSSSPHSWLHTLHSFIQIVTKMKPCQSSAALLPAPHSALLEATYHKQESVVFAQEPWCKRKLRPTDHQDALCLLYCLSLTWVDYLAKNYMLRSMAWYQRLNQLYPYPPPFTLTYWYSTEHWVMDPPLCH